VEEHLTVGRTKIPSEWLSSPLTRACRARLVQRHLPRTPTPSVRPVDHVTVIKTHLTNVITLRVTVHLLETILLLSW